MNKTRIGIIGLGGVGGFYGGLLAEYYSNDKTIEICFVARGLHYDKIKKEGLEIRQKGISVTVKPHLLVKDISALGKVDYLLLCTKAYDLEVVIEEMKKIITEHTIIIPLLNGVSAYEQLVSEFGINKIWKGCTYMVSRLIEPGVIDNPSGRQKIFFGNNFEPTSQMLWFEFLLKRANINAICTSEIAREVWEKYILVSASATGTTFYNCSIGTLMEKHLEAIRNLVVEATRVARSKGVALSENIEELVIERLKAIPYDSTTSMHSDFIMNKNSTEIEVMTGYMVESAKEAGIELPTYTQMYRTLLASQGYYNG